MIRKPLRKILVAAPAISFSNASKLEIMKEGEWLTFNRFAPTERNLSCFKSEIKEFPQNSWLVNVPGIPLVESGLKGVAGPGLPKDELFVPEAISERLSSIVGQYDKWRPYPAEKPLTPYAIEMALKFTKKRCKLLREIHDSQVWEFLFYVEHATASLAHLSEPEALVIFKHVVEAAIDASKAWSSCPIVVFSPYGAKSKPGFIASNIELGTKEKATWDIIRSYVNG